jgi:hypothetical protein
MPALSETRSDITDRQSGWSVPIYPLILLAFGGLLTIAWICALALFAYNVIWWLIG